MEQMEETTRSEIHRIVQKVESTSNVLFCIGEALEKSTFDARTYAPAVVEMEETLMDIARELRALSGMEPPSGAA